MLILDGRTLEVHDYLDKTLSPLARTLNPETENRKPYLDQEMLTMDDGRALRERSTHFLTFIVSHGIIKGKRLQFLGTNFVDKTPEPPESTYKTTFLVLFRIWYKICTRAWSPFPLILP